MTDTPPRKADGRFVSKSSDRNRAGAVALGAAGALLAAGAATVAGFFLAKRRREDAPHDAADLDRDDRPGADERAPVAFRPDIHATPTAAEREGLAPAMLAPEPATIESAGTTAERAPSPAVP